MAKGNKKNLIPFTQRTEEEQRNIATAGGVASGEARRRKGDLKRAIQILLEMDVMADNGEVVAGAEALAVRIFQLAMSGNLKAFELVRDTAGQKPSEKLEMEATVSEVVDVSKLTDEELDKILSQA